MKKGELLQHSQIRKKCNSTSNTKVKTWIYRKKRFQENKVTNVLETMLPPPKEKQTMF